MCTVVLAFDPGSSRPVLLGANRDEALDRPAEPPALRVLPGRTEVFCPLDREAGGTWIGLSHRGLLVAITNRFGTARDPRRASRGQLVLDALEAPSAEAAARMAQDRTPSTYNGFHLLATDRRQAFLVRGTGEETTAWPLAPGIHVLTERALGAGASARLDRLTARFLGVEPSALGVEALKTTLREGGDRGLEGVTVRVPGRSYGTRSSSWVALTAEDARFAWTDGPPDTHPFETRRLPW